MAEISRAGRSSMGQIFNILGCSLALAGTYAANRVSHDYFRELIPILVHAMRQAPRRVKIGNCRPYQGHTFMFDVAELLPDDQTSASTIILFEDGASIQRTRLNDLQKLIDHGGGGCYHQKDKLVFATRDNSSPLTNGRKYFAIHSLTRDTDAFTQLAQWRRDNTSEGALRLFEMLPMLCPRHFAYLKLHAIGEDVEMGDVSLALDWEAKLRMTAQSIAVRRRAPGSSLWQLSIRDIAADIDPENRWSFDITVDMAKEPAMLVPSARVNGPDGLELGYRIDASGRITIEAKRLRALRALMQPWFTDEAGVSAWLGELIDFLRISLADGGLGLTLDAPAEAALRGMLSDAAIDDTRIWTVAERRMTVAGGAA
jgi:hypothetical protein